MDVRFALDQRVAVEGSQVEAVSLTSHPREGAASKVDPSHKKQWGELPRVGPDGRNGEAGDLLLGLWKIRVSTNEETRFGCLPRRGT